MLRSLQLFPALKIFVLVSTLNASAQAGIGYISQPYRYCMWEYLYLKQQLDPYHFELYPEMGRGFVESAEDILTLRRLSDPIDYMMSMKERYLNIPHTHASGTSPAGNRRK